MSKLTLPLPPGASAAAAAAAFAAAGALEHINALASAWEAQELLQLLAALVEGWGDPRVRGLFTTRTVEELLWGYRWAGRGAFGWEAGGGGVRAIDGLGRNSKRVASFARRLRVPPPHSVCASLHPSHPPSHLPLPPPPPPRCSDPLLSRLAALLPGIDPTFRLVHNHSSPAEADAAGWESQAATGAGDVSQVWQLQEWQNASVVTAWAPPHVERVRGTDASQFRWGWGWGCEWVVGQGHVERYVLYLCLLRPPARPEMAATCPPACPPAGRACARATGWRCGWGSCSGPWHWWPLSRRGGAGWQWGWKGEPDCLQGGRNAGLLAWRSRLQGAPECLGVKRHGRQPYLNIPSAPSHLACLPIHPARPPARPHLRR